LFSETNTDQENLGICLLVFAKFISIMTKIQSKYFQNLKRFSMTHVGGSESVISFGRFADG